MKKKTGGGPPKPTVSCMQEPVLRQLVKIAGLEEMTIWRNRHHEWHLSVTVKSRPHVLYLSTRRACPGPSRALKRRSPRDSGSGPPGRSRWCSGKRRTRLRHAQLHRTSPTKDCTPRIPIGRSIGQIPRRPAGSTTAGGPEQCRDCPDSGRLEGTPHRSPGEAGGTKATALMPTMYQCSAARRELLE